MGGVIPLSHPVWGGSSNTGAQLLAKNFTKNFPFFIRGAASKPKVVPTSKKFFHVKNGSKISRKKHKNLMDWLYFPCLSSIYYIYPAIILIII